MLKIVGLTAGLALGTGTAAAGGHTFFARLSDNPSIPGHDKVRSRGRGRLDLHWGAEGSDTVLDFDLSVANLEEGASAAYIRGGGRADGPVRVTLHDDDTINDETVRGTIRDEDVVEGGVGDLIEELTEGNGVVTVHTGFE